MKKLKVAVTGGRGRMGRETVKTVLTSKNALLSGVLVNPNSSYVNRSVILPKSQKNLKLKYSSDAKAVFTRSDCVIDFSTPHSSLNYARIASETAKPLVIGTTGFSRQQLQEISLCAKNAPILIAYNMSLGIAALLTALRSWDLILKKNYQLHITDVHHKNKKDKPSGTALLLAQSSGHKAKDIKFTSIRKGSVIGEHHVLLSGPKEYIKITHCAKNRSLFSEGALAAAWWLSRQQVDLYSLEDMVQEKL